MIIAFSFLTALPFPLLNKINYKKKNISISVIFYPIVGLFYGLIIYLTAKYLNNIDKILLSIIVVTIPLVLSKFLHLDGLLDVFDAFLTSKSKEERLVILKDPHLGSYAVGGGIIFIILKTAVIKIMLSCPFLIIYFLIIPVLSKYAMVFLASISVYPRKSGTGQFLIGKINALVFITITIVTVLILTLFLLFNSCSVNFLVITVSAICTVFIITLLFKLYSYRKIGGVTGDVLGALNELVELCIPAIILIISRVIKIC